MLPVGGSTGERSSAPHWPAAPPWRPAACSTRGRRAPAAQGLRPWPGRPACGRQAKRTGGNLNVGLTGGGSSDTLNPFYGGISAIGTARAQQLYQPLVQLSNQAQLQYVLAEEIAPNGSTANWVIRCRPGVTFHNGKPFGADDVIYTLRTILNPKAPLGGALVLSPVDLKGLKKVDDLTVEVPMTSPFGSFPEQLASFWYFLYIAPEGWTQKDKPNGTGPFMYQSFTPGQRASSCATRTTGSRGTRTWTRLPSWTSRTPPPSRTLSSARSSTAPGN